MSYCRAQLGTTGYCCGLKAAASISSNPIASSKKSSGISSSLASACSGQFAVKVDYATAGQPTALAIGDLNGDGKGDMAVTNLGGDVTSVFLNKGNGTFAPKADYPAGWWDKDVVIGDLNADGKGDMVILPFSVFLNNGDGTFASQVRYQSTTNATTPTSVALGDLNGDGKADLAILHSGYKIGGIADAFVSIFLNDGKGKFTAGGEYPVRHSASEVAIGDLNGDGKGDLAVANGSLVSGNGSTSASLAILLNKGNGIFAAPVEYAAGLGAGAVAIGDVNGDGKKDVAVPHDGTKLAVYLNKGNGTFVEKTDYPTLRLLESLAISDLNGDGKADIAGAGIHGFLSIFQNNGDGTFALQTDYPAITYGAHALAAGDLNGDGKPDIAMTNMGGNSVSVFINTGTSCARSSFQAVSSVSSPRSSVVSSRTTSSVRSTPSCLNGDVCIPYEACLDKGGKLKDPGTCNPVAGSTDWCCQLPPPQSSARASSVAATFYCCLPLSDYRCVPVSNADACKQEQGILAETSQSCLDMCAKPISSVRSSARSSVRSSVRSSSRVSSVRSSQRSSATSVMIPSGRMRVTITRAESTDPTYPVQPIIYLPDETVMAPSGQWFRLPPTPDMYGTVRGISMMGTGDRQGRFRVNPSDFMHTYIGHSTFYGTIEVAGTQFTAITCPEGAWYCPEQYRDGITAEPDNDEVWIENGIIHFAIHAKNVTNSAGSLDQFDFSWTVPGSSASSVRSTFNGNLCPDANGVYDPSCKQFFPLPSQPFFVPSQWGGSLLSVAGTAPAGFIVLVVMLAGLIGGFLYRRRR